ncbi:CRISPR-associated protein, Cas6 family [Saccharicrinis carchari]|uniref:CRISPR-associated endoribonuclease n=1 Tax=Saccharicrinis carchari TaxID=1168039 RepID=A0A521EA30_SACCC|nr:CRISPR-associated endoribonuclease Cas6 [Saccharicrinis carchari]SMO80769.1 CRISPR-associated protein, Cas6 family [Saccharicrinis carchari]
MRLKITLNRTSRQRMLPMDYQYLISAWIYKVLKQADKDFASFLHEKGYGLSDTKLYKLFCFSRLDFGKPKMWKERKLFEIKEQEITLQISFDVSEAATHFIKGLFMSQEFYLGDRFNGIDFKVTSVEALAEPEFSETMHYRLQTPWVVSYKPEGRKYAQYLKPNEPMFNTLSVKHLKEKFLNTRKDGTIETPIVLKLCGPSKRSGFLVKSGTNKETRVVGNIFDFELQAPIELQKMLWNAGVSEKSSSGFGWCEVNNKQMDN